MKLGQWKDLQIMLLFGLSFLSNLFGKRTWQIFWKDIKLIKSLPTSQGSKVYYFTSNNDENYLVSPADGVVLQVKETNGPKELNLENKTFTKVSVFMNVFDCHVNRTPCSGKVSQILYKPGKFFNASLDKASEDNERNYYKITNTKGEDIVVVQIAGLIARRIVCETNEDTDLQQGDRIGMIRFGSRADLYFENYKPLVKVDQKTIAGETLIAKK